MKLRHFDHDNRARFITFCVHKRLPILTNNLFRQIVIGAIGKSKCKYDFKILGYVIMPEHVHLVIIPDKSEKAGSIVSEIKQISSKLIHQLLKENNSDLIKKLTVIRNRLERFTLWQRRFYDHNCRKENIAREKINYCHNNPVKRGLVKEPADWQWSSYRNYNGYDDCKLEIDLLEL